MRFSPGRDVGRARAATPPRRRQLVLAHGDTVLALRSEDDAAIDWLVEFLSPWFTSSDRAPEYGLTITTSSRSRREVGASRPVGALPRACFALDQEVVSLPSWTHAKGIAVDDSERSCLFVAAPSRVDLFPDVGTLRWRFTLQWICHELAANRLRRSALDLHAAAVEAGGHAIAIVGPKGAGKTTLSLHLLRSRRCRWIANDRAFAGAGAASIHLRGMPTAVKLLPATRREFPELLRGLRPVERPYLRTIAEAIGPSGAERRAGAGATPRETRSKPSDAGELALSPAQIAHQLQVTALAEAPLRAIVFPEIRADRSGSRLVRLDAPELAERLRSYLYGNPSRRSVATVFEALEGGFVAARHERAAELSERVPGFRVELGPDAYACPDFASRFLDGALS